MTGDSYGAYAACPSLDSLTTYIWRE